jgi:hypothetical protein
MARPRVDECGSRRLGDWLFHVVPDWFIIIPGGDAGVNDEGLSSVKDFPSCST